MYFVSKMKQTSSSSTTTTKETIKRTSDLLLSGWKMLSNHCPICSSPLLSKDNTMRCPGCNVPVVMENEANTNTNYSKSMQSQSPQVILLLFIYY